MATPDQVVRGRASEGREGKIPLAVFDFDNTMIDGQTGVIFTRYLLDKGYVSHATVAKVIAWGAKYFVRLPVEQNRVREYIFSDLVGMTTEEFEDISKDFHDKVLTRLYRSDALRTLTERQREGCATLVASATFEPVVAEVARHLGMDGYTGTVMEVDDSGRYTGFVEGRVVQAEDKLERILDWGDEHLGAGRWKLTYAYGDHHSDYDTLDAADHPVAVHPSFSLWRAALRLGWPIERWR